MNKEVDLYINRLEQDWQRNVVARLRKLIHETEPDIKETIKWGAPAFEHDGLVVWLFCAKEWVHFSFPQGALLDEPHYLFEKTNNKAKRTIKFKETDMVPDELIRKLVGQAVELNKAGKKVIVKKSPKKRVTVPKDIKFELKARVLEKAYEERPYYQQKGYVQWVTNAKRLQTRSSRIRQMVKELKDGTYMPPKRDR
jgi:hypothetical protein